MPKYFFLHFETCAEYSGPDPLIFNGFTTLKTAITLLKTLADSGFTAVCPVPKGFTKESQIKWGLDGMPPTMPDNVQLADNGVPVVAVMYLNFLLMRVNAHCMHICMLFTCACERMHTHR